MFDLTTLAREHANLPEDEQKKAGQAIGGAMGDAYKQFLETILTMIRNREIDFQVPETFLNKEIYNALGQEARAKVDLSMVNLADLLRHITEFFLSKKTPDESPHLQTMIEQLWLMKEKVEKQYGDVFKF